MTQHEPNTQGASWEEGKDQLMIEELLDSGLSVSTITRITERIRTLLSKERAEGERRERERILAALPKDMTMEAAHKSGSDAGAGYTIGYNAAVKEVRESITTLPADSTEDTTNQ